MVGINGFSKINSQLDAVNTAREKRTAGVKAKDGESKLSKKAADYLNKLREERPEFDFSVSNGKGIKKFSGASDKEFSVIFTSEELEKMADDEQYAEEKLNSLDKIVDMSDKITKDDGFASLLGENAESDFWADAINFSITDDGEISIFADIRKTAESKNEETEKANEKTDTKSFKERAISRDKIHDKAAEIIKIEAASLDDFLYKLRNIA